MIPLSGKYNNCKIFTDNIDSQTISQIINLLNQEFTKDLQIRIMPDCHAGKGCVIGTTMTIKDKIVPYLVGSDIGCGVLTVKLMDENIDFKKLDFVIRNNIPNGASVHQNAIKECHILPELYMPTENISKYNRSIATLGGGNHFIEIDKNKNGELFLLIHTGSRTLGREICSFYQTKAKEVCEKNKISVCEELSFVSKADYLEAYLHDADIARYFAKINRQTIADIIMNKMNLKSDYSFDTVHNYIDTENSILRKGAVSANAGEKLIIPINMRDGSLICLGRGNNDWNFSAPHGAGRLLSRSEAKEKLSLEDYKLAMDGIYSTSVKQSTLDESPMAYKSYEEIVNNISQTVTILDHIKPVYNFKSSK